MKKSHLLFLATLFLLACGTTKLITPTQADADRGTKKFTNLSLNDLNQGKFIFEQNCNLCHGLKKPASRNEDQWKNIVPKMVKKVNHKKGPDAISAKNEETLLKYLITMSEVK